MRTRELIAAAARLDAALTAAYKTGLEPGQAMLLFDDSRKAVAERAAMLDDMHARIGAGHPEIKAACEAVSAALRPDLERPLCQMLEDWCAAEGLECMSADELERSLWHRQQELETQHECTDRLQDQRRWLQAYIELWDLSV